MMFPKEQQCINSTFNFQLAAPVSIPSQAHNIIPNHMIAAPTQDSSPRCNTLFVANLSHNATETELRNIFKS